MQKEYNALTINGIWELASLSSNRKAIGCKWSFHEKLLGSGSLDNYKSMMVSFGYLQETWIAFYEHEIS